MSRFITTLDALTAAGSRRLLLLYSGGVDGTYLLRRLREHGVDAVALCVRIGDHTDVGAARHGAETYGVPFEEVDATGEFYAEFVPCAVHADAYYHGLFPVGSTLTRPLMARVAARMARALGCDTVAHTATYMQNSSARLTRSLAALDPALTIAAPFLGADVPREHKLAALASDGITFATGIHSIDVNPWARVIECGTLESPENSIPDEVFTWTADPDDAPAGGAEIELGFAGGLPVSCDGVATELAELVPRLNALAGAHGVGRFSGLEETPFGVKNHEVREAPAAAVITTAHRALANAVLGGEEHAVRAQVATRWTDTAVQGGWFSHLGVCLAGCLAALDGPVGGTVRLRLHRGGVRVLSVASDSGLYYTRFGEEFHRLMGGYAFGPWLSLLTLPESERTGLHHTAPVVQR